jgi:hypothetical protein
VTNRPLYTLLFSSGLLVYSLSNQDTTNIVNTLVMSVSTISSHGPEVMTIVRRIANQLKEGLKLPQDWTCTPIAASVTWHPKAIKSSLPSQLWTALHPKHKEKATPRAHLEELECSLTWPTQTSLKVRDITTDVEHTIQLCITVQCGLTSSYSAYDPFTEIPHWISKTTQLSCPPRIIKPDTMSKEIWHSLERHIAPYLTKALSSGGWEQAQAQQESNWMEMARAVDTAGRQTQDILDKAIFSSYHEC